ncbi:MAG TPA: hypothetical protein VFC29_05675 [Candidatus Limnocylindrales bacterium]|jgi:hypothetical protein|nr:hypothetical protein [Candidatus Limnocylindrales bacterium]
MKNAHERFGKLAYQRRTEKTATNIRVFLDAFVGEERGRAHLVSVVGGDVEIGAPAAAFANGDPFTVIDPSGAESIVSLGEKPLCFRRGRMGADDGDFWPDRSRETPSAIALAQFRPRFSYD